MSLTKPINLNIADKLENDKEYREEFFRGQAQDIIAMSIRGLRKKRSMLQKDLAKESGMLQSAISRVEQAEYSAWSFSTLFRVADALDARLKITLEPAEDVIEEYKKMEDVNENINEEYLQLREAKAIECTADVAQLERPETEKTIPFIIEESGGFLKMTSAGVPINQIDIGD